MFTGIVAGVGRVRAIERRSGGGARLTVAPPRGERPFRRGESVSVSGVCLTSVSSGRELRADLSADPRFVEARARRVYRGPVYFRKESEPYMAIAIAEGDKGGVTAAEVNLKFIWDVVSQIKVGKAGQAFVVDGQGALIAHPDISLVLQKTDMGKLDHVKGALVPARPGESGESVTIARNKPGWKQ